MHVLQLTYSTRRCFEQAPRTKYLDVLESIICDSGYAVTGRELFWTIIIREMSIADRHHQLATRHEEGSLAALSFMNLCWSLTLTM